MISSSQTKVIAKLINYYTKNVSWANAMNEHADKHKQISKITRSTHLNNFNNNIELLLPMYCLALTKFLLMDHVTK